MTTREKFMFDYIKHSEFAAAYAVQQMLDRDNERYSLAEFCQERAAFHAAEARAARNLYLAAGKVSFK